MERIDLTESVSKPDSPRRELQKGGGGPWRRLLAKLLLLGISCLVGFLLGEIVVRIVRPGFPGFRIPQVVHRPAPGIGFEMVPGQRAYTFAQPVTVNAYGCRGPELKTAGDAARTRILCLGDSLTFGVGVADEQVYPRLIEAHFMDADRGTQTEVINAAVQRYFTYQEMDWLRQKGLRLQPDVVILGVYANDLGLRPAGDYVREYEKEREQVASSLRRKAPWIYLVAKNSALVELVKQSVRSWSASRNAVNLLEGRSKSWSEKRWEAMGQELAAFAQLARQYGFQPLVLAIPSRSQVGGNDPGADYPAKLHGLCEQLGLPSVDFIAEFKESLAEGRDPYLRWDNHMSAVGHQLVAKRTQQALQDLYINGSQNPRKTDAMP